jgi:hypothetical protein
MIGKSDDLLMRKCSISLVPCLVISTMSRRLPQGRDLPVPTMFGNVQLSRPTTTTTMFPLMFTNYLRLAAAMLVFEVVLALPLYNTLATPNHLPYLQDAPLPLPDQLDSAPIMLFRELSNSDKDRLSHQAIRPSAASSSSISSQTNALSHSSSKMSLKSIATSHEPTTLFVTNTSLNAPGTLKPTPKSWKPKSSGKMTGEDYYGGRSARPKSGYV